MPQSPVTGKVVMTRAERRGVLRHQLRDTGESVWTDAVLNDCLNEALTFVRSRYPWVRTTSLAAGYRLYDLPADFVRMREVLLVPDGDSEGIDIDPWPHGRVLTGWEVSGTNPRTIAAGDDASHVINFNEAIPDSHTVYITFESAMQDWGDHEDVDAGADVGTQDLCPGELTDGLAPLLLYAAARCAAYRYALNYIKSDGGDDFAAQYEYALRERDRLLAAIAAAPAQARFTSGLF